ncbi:hypothetical protein [Levyella massiliensis]|uniref:hypothetical protein n=1 Tax=Levyella massiliensis TaxID=938289 RepID=UPI00399C3F75
MIGELAEDVILREIKEEHEIEASIIRPLWLNQAFFTEDVDELQYHEICIFFNRYRRVIYFTNGK